MQLAVSTADPSDKITVSWYEAIPPFAETELARLYGHIHSSLAFFKTSRPTESVGTYVAWQGDRPIAMLVFQCKNGKVDVYNEMISISEEEIHRFACHVFEHFSKVDIISFKALQSDLKRLPFPFQRHNSKENWVIDLPATPDEYTARLGKATRENVRRYRKRLVRDYPSFNHQVHINDEIDEQNAREIIELSKVRISSKKKKFGIDDEEAQRIFRLAKECGIANVMRIDDRLCAGTLSYCVGSEHLAEVVAHDTHYNEYRLGTLCYYVTICESITRGAKRFHMGGGRNEYKTRLLGVRQDMDRLEIYRSYRHMMLNPHRVLKTTIQASVRRVKVWLLERENSLVTRSVFRSLHLFRTFTGKDG